MASANVKTNKIVRPVIYCFTTPNDISHRGYCKIGYTDKYTSDECIYQESRRTDTFCKKEWEAPAIFDTSSYTTFTDHDFHNYLDALGIERKESVYAGKRRPEYFKISPERAKELLNKFREMTDPEQLRKTYKLRDEQQEAVDLMLEYMQKSARKDVLLNAKPRFGKTLAVYDYCRKIDAEKILVVTNRPVIATSWYNDYVKFLGTDEYIFVSNCDAARDKEFCLSREEYVDRLVKDAPVITHKLIEFVSLQDMRGSRYFGNGPYDKLYEESETDWDLLVVDESHEGVDTSKTQTVLKQVKRKETIYLSGTPFKQIANNKFPKEAIYNWTYADEQERKATWNYEMDDVNPYEDLPQLNLFTYRLADMFADENRMEEDDDRSRLFDLNEFFRATDNNKFVNDADVDKFLDTITTNPKYPLANAETRNEIRHSLWLLDRVNSAKALATKLRKNPEFADYEIIVAAGDGRADETDKIDNSFVKVTDKIRKYDKTITISVGQLTTGVTIPEWSAVFMLCNVESPSLYIQAAFRAQNPCMIQTGNGEFIRKENAYIFDFDPVRTLDIMGKFANDLYSDTASGAGTVEQRAANINKLIRYFPIVGEDDNGELVEYKPQDVISIPSKIQAKEIVKHGFMSSFLFQNIGRIFADPKAMKALEQVKEHKTVHTAPSTETLKYDEYGNTTVDETKVNTKIGDALKELDSMLPDNELDEAITDLHDKLSPEHSFLETLRDMKTAATQEQKAARTEAVDEFVKERAEKLKKAISEVLGDNYSGILNAKKVESDIVDQYTAKVSETKTEHDISMEKLRKKYEDKRRNLTDKDEIKSLVKQYDNEKNEMELDFACSLDALENQFKTDVISDTIKDLEFKEQKHRNKKAEEDYAFPKLKAFARSIPSFLMAYGDRNTTCNMFGEIIPKDIFKEMTGIELEDYMYFIEKEYFNEVTFNDAIREFYDTRVRLANYFEDQSEEDIFDYIPPQKTNQIFTPKKVVVEMADLLEENDPGCFDDPDKTFIDPYMKSGLFIAEMVKRLFRSERLKELFPDESERLNHIFAEQVYGLAPTEIIYRIAVNFVLGFSDQIKIEKHNLKQFDATPYAKDGTLYEELEKMYFAS